MASASDVPPISGLVPMVHVADIDRSIAFYRRLGFEVGNSVPPSGPPQWVWMYAPGAVDWKRGPNLMLTRSECPVDGWAQHWLLYLYAADLPGLRERLRSEGIDAGDITYPDYLPDGEFELRDPDGFLLMIAQSGETTP